MYDGEVHSIYVENIYEDKGVVVSYSGNDTAKTPGKYTVTALISYEDIKISKSYYAMYLYICDYLSQSEYNKYEISNFARDGKASRHNLKYWQLDDYLGFGAAAHSYFDSERFSNAPN